MARKSSVRRSNRAERRNTRQSNKNSIQAVLDPSMEIIPQRRNPEPLKPKNETQKRYINAIKSSAYQVVFGLGSAGTGKTYIAGALACEQLEAKQIEKIIITRPAVEAGESLGFLPGELEEKYEPYLAAFRDVLNDRLGKSYVDYLIKVGRIEARPLAYLRGMAEPVSSIIPTPDGFKRMGDLKVGDYVLGSDGKPTKVLEIHPQGVVPVADVYFADGEIVRCSKNHLWSTRNQTARTRGKPFTPKTTEEIQKTLCSSSGVKKHEIPLLSNPVEFEKQEVPIDPYFLGLLLGDGCISVGAITFTTADSELIDWIKVHLENSALTVKENKSSKTGYDFTIVKKNNTGLRESPLKDSLRELGLWGKKSENKFVPKQYLYNSSDVRLELLRGLMDTDGSVYHHDNKKKNKTRVEYSSSSPALAFNVMWIVQSLGGIARIRRRKVYTSIKEIGGCKFSSNYDNFVVDIVLPKHINPFRLKRKANKFNPSNLFRLIENVVDVGEEECQCITVEASDHLYLTGNFVVTHNTFKNCIVILDEAQNCTKEQMKLFLTRIGENCKVIIDGDESQSDIRGSGLMDAMNRISFIPSVKVIRFLPKDVVRSGLVAEILQSYEEPVSSEIRIG